MHSSDTGVSQRLIKRLLGQIYRHTSHKQLDSSRNRDLLLEGFALRLQVAGVPVQNMSVVRLDVHVLEEVVPHVGVIALGMIPGKA